jgi:hypothetical protein
LARSKQGSGEEPITAGSRLVCFRNPNDGDAFHAQDGKQHESNVMTPIKNAPDLEGEPEPKTAFLLGLALGAILPLLVLATSSA